MYNKLFTKILDSSIWMEPSTTRIVWLTFIAAMDEDGFAQFAGIPNLAHRAVVTVEEAAAAVAALESPDPDSSDPENEGRRVERVPGGWMVLNATKYREMVTRVAGREQTRLRVARHRAKRNADVTPCNADVTPPPKRKRKRNAPVMQSEAEAEAYTESNKKSLAVRSTAAPASQPWLSIFEDAYTLAKGAPYKRRRGDFVQLAALIKAMGDWLTTERFAQSVAHYFSSDIGTHTLADLSVRFGDFYRSAMDRYKVPIARPESINGTPTRRESENERKRRETRESIAEGFRAAGNHRTADRILAGESWPFADGTDGTEADGKLLAESAGGHTNR